jgi:fibrillarin-like rRNA methylase
MDSARRVAIKNLVTRIKGYERNNMEFDEKAFREWSRKPSKARMVKLLRDGGGIPKFNRVAKVLQDVVRHSLWT